MRKLLSALALVAAIAVAPVALHATPITGQFSLQGTVVNSGTSLDFSVGTVYSGHGTQTGVFSVLIPDGSPVTSGPTDLVFNPYTCCASFTVGNLTTTLDTLTFSELNVGGVPLYGFGGIATFVDNSGVYSSTTGTFGFSAQQSGPVTFSATGIAATSPVPEPSTLALMGSGVLGLAGVVRRKFLA